jgi:uncharacterized protein (TIGR02611 family)
MGALRNSKRILVGFIGWTVILVGLVLIPFPGPGWVIVFIGFSILAREFDWAKTANEDIRTKYMQWRRWFVAQPRSIQLAFGLLSLATAAVIVWLVNGYGMMNAFLHLNQPWLVSPFFN